MPNQVPEDVKSARLQRLQALLTQQQKDFMQSLVGKHMDVLIEKPGREAGQIVGRSPWLQPVICHENVGQVGDIVNVKISQVMVNSLVSDEIATKLGQ